MRFNCHQIEKNLLLRLTLPRLIKAFYYLVPALPGTILELVHVQPYISVHVLATFDERSATHLIQHIL